MIPEPYYDDGQITIYNADCRDVLPTFSVVSGVDLLLTDPPYGMRWDTNFTRFSGGIRGHRSYGDGRNYGVAINGDSEPFDPTPLLDFPRVIIWGMHHFAQRLPVGSTLVWIKRFDDAFGSFLSDAEFAWMKGGYGVYCKRDTSLMAETRMRAHPTQKPIPLMKWCIEKAKTPSGGLVLDPYMGSGTTLVAAKQTGRRAIGIEIEGKYCEIAVKRLQQSVLPLEMTAD